MISLSSKAKQWISPMFYRKVLHLPQDQRVVSFTFDDVPRSAFDLASAALEDMEARGTFYVALSMMEGLSEKAGAFAYDDLEHCLSKGHELGCHTFSHLHFHRTHDIALIRQDMESNQRSLEQNGINVKLRDFSYPYGEQSMLARKAVSERYRTARGIEEGINRGSIDLYNLKSVKLYQSENPLEKIFRIMENLKRHGGWLVFYTHDIQDSYSIFGCSEDYFKSVLQKCRELNLTIKTVGRTVTDIQ